MPLGHTINIDQLDRKLSLTLSNFESIQVIPEPDGFIDRVASENEENMIAQEADEEIWYRSTNYK